MEHTANIGKCCNELEGQLKQMEADRVERESVITSLATDVVWKDAFLMAKDDAIQAKDATIKNLNEQIDKLEDALANASGTNQTVHIETGNMHGDAFNSPPPKSAPKEE